MNLLPGFFWWLHFCLFRLSALLGGFIVLGGFIILGGFIPRPSCRMACLKLVNPALVEVKDYGALVT